MVCLFRDFVPGEAEVVVRGMSWGDENTQSPSPQADLDNYIDEKVKQLKSNGLIIEMRSKSETFSSDNQKNFFLKSFHSPLF